jgi:hypothetical protein
MVTVSPACSEKRDDFQPTDASNGCKLLNFGVLGRSHLMVSRAFRPSAQRYALSAGIVPQGIVISAERFFKAWLAVIAKAM